jgi:hypothetical protein
MMDKSAIFRRALGCLGRANLRMGPSQPFPLAVSGKITQIFLETQVIWGMSAKLRKQRSPRVCMTLTRPSERWRGGNNADHRNAVWS